MQTILKKKKTISLSLSLSRDQGDARSCLVWRLSQHSLLPESALPSTLLTEHMQPGTAENIIIAVVSRLRYQAAPEVMLLILELMSK